MVERVLWLRVSPATPGKSTGVTVRPCRHALTCTGRALLLHFGRFPRYRRFLSPGIAHKMCYRCGRFELMPVADERIEHYTITYGLGRINPIHGTLREKNTQRSRAICSSDLNCVGASRSGETSDTQEEH